MFGLTRRNGVLGFWEILQEIGTPRKKQTILSSFNSLFLYIIIIMVYYY